MTSLTVSAVNLKNKALCWGCSKMGWEEDEGTDKFCCINNKKSILAHSICIDCYNKNIQNKLMHCQFCDNHFLLDFTKLKKNDFIKYGFDEFLYCFNCLNKEYNKNIKTLCFGELAKNLNNEEEITPQFNNYNDSIVRIIGTKTLDFNEDKKNEKKNINKKISNCNCKDKQKFNVKPDITYDNIYKLLQIQKYECYICNERVLTTGYKPYCCNQFSIDRIDNTKPHNKDNVKISCYFCNCKDDALYDKIEKICDIDNCDCINLLKYEKEIDDDDSDDETDEPDYDDCSLWY